LRYNQYVFVLKWHLSLCLKLKSCYTTNLELPWVYLVAVVVSPLSCSIVSLLSCCIRTVFVLCTRTIKVRSYFMTDGQSVGMSWYRALLWDLWPDITSCQNVAVWNLRSFLWGALSDERTGLQFTVQSLNGPSRVEPVTILYCLIWDLANLEGQVPIFISPRNKVAQLYPWAVGSLYFISYDSQGYGGGIPTLP
jgi:hypothetical protein